MGNEKLFCKGGGCTAKLGAGVLSRVLERLPKFPADPALLIGYDSKDDAAVYKLTDEVAVVQTLDFFPPMVDDPYTFGQIAATNALSDVWAMGGEVKTALNIVFFAGMALFFMDTLSGMAANAGQSVIVYMVLGLAGINFVVELLVNIALSSGITHIIKSRKRGRA